MISYKICYIIYILCDIIYDVMYDIMSDLGLAVWEVVVILVWETVVRRLSSFWRLSPTILILLLNLMWCVALI